MYLALNITFFIEFTTNNWLSVEQNARNVSDSDIICFQFSQLTLHEGIIYHLE